MREIVFDTETTGLSPKNGDRVVEIGMVEIMDLVPTGRHFHVYINPLMPVPIEAQRVHGLTNAFLEKHPTFADPLVVDAMLEFMGDARLVAHNAEFDRAFINAELGRLNLPIIEQSRCIDTILIARRKFPGAPASLDALCKRFNIDLKERDKHGALLDAKLLAAVYLELSGGRERTFGFFESKNSNQNANIENTNKTMQTRKPRPQKLAPLITEQELSAHQEFIKKLGDDAFWLLN